MPHDTVNVADFADVECKASAKSVTVCAMREQQPIPLDTGCIFMLIILNEKLPLTGSWHIRRLGVFLRFFKWGYLSIGGYSTMRMKKVFLFNLHSSAHDRTFVITVTVRVSTVADYFVLWDLEWLGAT